MVLSIFPPNLFSFFWKIISLLCQAFLRPPSLPQLKQSVPVQPPPSCAVFRSLKSPSVWIPIIHKLWLNSALLNLITVSWGTWTAAATENASSVEPRALAIREIRSHFILYRYFIIFKCLLPFIFHPVMIALTMCLMETLLHFQYLSELCLNTW